MRRQHEDASPVKVTFAHGDGELPVCQLPDAVPEPLAVQARANQGAIVCHPEDDSTPAWGIGHTGHLAC
jgi:hypothetical protein